MCIYALFSFPSCSHQAYVAHRYCPELQTPGGEHEARPTISPYCIQMLFADDKTLLERKDFVKQIQEIEPTYFTSEYSNEGCMGKEQPTSTSMLDLTHQSHNKPGWRNVVDLTRNGARSVIDLTDANTLRSSHEGKRLRRKRYDPVQAQRVHDVALAVAEANNRSREGVNPHSAIVSKQRDRTRRRETRIINRSEYPPAAALLNAKRRCQRKPMPSVVYEEDEEEVVLDDASSSNSIDVSSTPCASSIQRNAEDKNKVPESLRRLHVRAVQYHVIYTGCQNIESYKVNGWPFVETVCGACAKKAWRAEKGRELLRKKSGDVLREISGKLKINEGVKRRVSDGDSVEEKEGRKFKRNRSMSIEDGRKGKWKGWLRWKN